MLIRIHKNINLILQYNFCKNKNLTEIGKYFYSNKSVGNDTSLHQSENLLINRNKNNFIIFGHKNFCNDTNIEMALASYAEIKELPNCPEKLLIDVREPDEIKDTGKIPTSINIPLGQLESELKLDSTVFSEKYGRSKPTSVTEVIFHCKMGGRAGKAADFAKSVGFNNAKNYKGSWLEWAEKEGLPK